MPTTYSIVRMSLFWTGAIASFLFKTPIGYQYIFAILFCVSQKFTIEVLKDKCNVLENQLFLLSEEVEKAKLQVKDPKLQVKDLNNPSSSHQPIPPPIKIPKIP